MQVTRHEAVVDEEVFLDRQCRVATLEVTGAVVDDTVAENQVLRACGGADGIGLKEAELRDCLPNGGRLEERAGDGVAAEVGESWRSHEPHSRRGATTAAHSGTDINNAGIIQNASVSPM